MRAAIRPRPLPSALLAVALMGALAAGDVHAQLGPDGAQLLEQGIDGMPDLADPDDRFGRAVVAGDFDGDGRDDLAIGAPGEVVADFVGAGQVTVTYGAASGLDATAHQILSSDDFGIGAAILDQAFGHALAAGDFDGDGFDDLAVGIPWRSYLPMGGAAAWNTGMVIVVHGSAAGLDLARDQLLVAGVDGVPSVAESGDRFGRSLAAGDFDGDGIDDLAIGVPEKDVNGHADAGQLVVLRGTATGLQVSGGWLGVSVWDQEVVGLDASDDGEQFAASLVAGDFDGDGIDDLAIGTPFDEVLGAPSAGSVTVLYGTAFGLLGVNAVRVDEAGPAPGTFGPEDYFGAALAAGDLDCDGFDDLAVGVPADDLDLGGGMTVANAGAVIVYFGSATGVDEGDAVLLDRIVADGSPSPSDAFGDGLAAGDFDADRCDDLVVGVPGGDPEGVEGAGTVFVFAGQPGGPIAVDQLSQAGPTPGTTGSGDHLGSHLAVGDFDGDRAADLAAGVPLDTSGAAADAGQVNVFYGNGVPLFADGFELGDLAAWSAVSP